MPPEEVNRDAYRIFWEDLRAGRSVSGEFHRIGKGGNPVWLQASYNTIIDPNGKPFKIVKFGTDITKATLEQQAMENAERERNEKDRLLAEEQQRKVASVLEVVNKLAGGDFDVSVPEMGNDAVGQVATALRQAIASMRALKQAEQERNENDRRRSEEQQVKVESVLRVVSSVARGDFGIQVPDLGDDAVGQVAAALGQAVGAIRSTLIEVQDVAGTVNLAASELTSASREISSGAQTQASNLEETASSLEEITSTVKQNSDNAQQARQLATSSRDVAEKGGAVVGDAVKAMAEINDSSKKIADIITTIDEIAFKPTCSLLTQLWKQLGLVNKAVALRLWPPRFATWPNAVPVPLRKSNL